MSDIVVTKLIEVTQELNTAVDEIHVMNNHRQGMRYVNAALMALLLLAFAAYPLIHTNKCNQNMSEIIEILNTIKNDRHESQQAMLFQKTNLTERQSRMEDDIIDMDDQLIFIQRTLARLQNVLATQKDMQLKLDKRLDLLIKLNGIKFS